MRGRHTGLAQSSVHELAGLAICVNLNVNGPPPSMHEQPWQCHMLVRGGGGRGQSVQVDGEVGEVGGGAEGMSLLTTHS